MRARFQGALPHLGGLVHNPIFQAVLLAVAYAAIASFVSILRHQSYQTCALDLGLFAQTLKSTLQGDILYSSIDGMSSFGYHFTPILLLLVPIFWLAPHCETLLIVQSLALGLGGYLVYNLGRSQGLNHKVTLAIEFLFFINPLVYGVNFYDFHPVVFAVPALLIMITGLVQRRWRLFTLGLILALMTKETIALILLVFGLVMLIACYLRSKKVEKVYLVVILASIATYGIAAVVARAASGLDCPPLLAYASIRYAYIDEPIAQAIPDALCAFFSVSSLFLIFAYFLPLAFLPLLSPLWVAPALLILIMGMLSTNVNQHCLRQYHTAAIPFLFTALIIGLAQMKKGRLMLLLRRIWRPLLAVMILAAVLVNLYPTSVFRDSSFSSLPASEVEAIDSMISLVPDDATVTAQRRILPHLCCRTDAYLAPCLQPANEDYGDFGVPYRETEYVVIDWQQRHQYQGGCWEDEIVSYLEGKYGLLAQAGSVSLYKLDYEGPLINLP